VPAQAQPNAEILLSFPGLGPLLAARVLAEIGDDRTRFDSARGLKAHAGSAPITRSSSKKRYVGRRHIKNDRLCHAGHLWTFASLSASPGAKAHYQHRRAHGDWHAAAQRHLFNRFLGQLHHCLKTRQPYAKDREFTQPLTP
jgi:transposase